MRTYYGEKTDRSAQFGDRSSVEPSFNDSAPAIRMVTPLHKRLHVTRTAQANEAAEVTAEQRGAETDAPFGRRTDATTRYSSPVRALQGCRASQH
jgi:hypothetical protein